MERVISYKQRLIRGESFQLPQSDSWIPRYTLVCEDIDKRQSDDFLTYRDWLDKVFWTKNEADEFALKEAMQWIDRS
jgi:hypothetical protein